MKKIIWVMAIGLAFAVAGCPSKKEPEEDETAEEGEEGEEPSDETMEQLKSLGYVQ